MFFFNDKKQEFLVLFPLLEKSQLEKTITAMLNKCNIYHSHLVCLILLWSNLAHFEDDSKT
jgi:hypothetical protein